MRQADDQHHLRVAETLSRTAFGRVSEAWEESNPFRPIRLMATAIFDALPYYDNDLEVHPELRSKVEKELAREGKPPTTLHPKVPPPIDLFSVGISSFASTSFLDI